MLFQNGNKKARKGLKIVIVGCGKIGSTLTEKLYKEGHDITVVDVNGDRLQSMAEQYDVMGVQGNGASFQVQKDAGVGNADLFIAVTDKDELNLLCCIVAHFNGKCAAIARVRTPDYSDEVGFLKTKLDLAMVINPEQQTAHEMARILSLPEALAVNSFARGSVEMVRFKIPEGCVLDGQTLMRLGTSFDCDVLICAVERNREIYIPGGSFELRSGDVVSFIATMPEARKFFGKIDIRAFDVKRTLIVGGGKASYYLARHLIENGIGVKIIEKDIKRCDELGELLPQAEIICGDGTNAELLAEEEIGEADAFIPLTSIDEENIMLTLYAADVSDAKVITKIQRKTFHKVIERLQLGSIIYPREITAEAIVAFVRGMAASRGNDNIETLYHMFDNRVEAVEFSVRAESKATNIPLKDLKLRDNTLVACIIRDGQSMIPRGLDEIRTRDNVIIVTTHTGLHVLDDILK